MKKSRSAFGPKQGKAVVQLKAGNTVRLEDLDPPSTDDLRPWGAPLTLDAPLPLYSTAYVPGFVAWPEFARNVGPGLGPESDTGGCGAATGV